MGGMASAAANDISIGLGLKDDPERGRPQYRGGDGLTDYQRRTKASVDRMRAPSAADKEDDRPRQPAPPRAAPAPNYGIGAVAAAPSVPDPDAIGETEQALLDQQKKGRSSTITTSARGLLAGEDDTRKKRSLMGGLIS
mgnify:FL=1